MKYKILAFDLDGTLLTPQKSILPESVEALRAAQSVGIKIILTSGRHNSTIQPFYEQLGLATPVICCNGSYMYDFSKEKIINP
jgi:hypothetical protein